MAYTDAEKTSVKAALIALATGARVASVTIDGHETIEYSQEHIDKLKSFYDGMFDTKRRFVLTSTSKGL